MSADDFDEFHLSTDCRKADHDRISQETEDFERRGGIIQKIPSWVRSMTYKIWVTEKAARGGKQGRKARSAQKKR